MNTKQSDNTFFDYKNQAWVVQGKYMSCGHPENMNCNCYGKKHQGELADNISICSECGKQVNDDTETKFDEQADPYCDNCYIKVELKESEE